MPAAAIKLDLDNPENIDVPDIMDQLEEEKPWMDGSRDPNVLYKKTEKIIFLEKEIVSLNYLIFKVM